MKNIVPYIMGVAAKSNIEKRQVGCVITAECDIFEEYIVGEGFNDEEHHAEWHALDDMMARGELPDKATLTAYVTHPPCPECAKKLAERGIDKVEVVEQFMKFDSDKLRYDLIDKDFIEWLFKVNFGMDKPYNAPNVKHFLYACELTKHSIKGVLPQVVWTYRDTQAVEDALAKVLTFGASKYKPNNWRHCQDIGRYLAAAHRHNNAIMHGEDKDDETGFDHKDHLLCNLMFLYALTN